MYYAAFFAVFMFQCTDAIQYFQYFSNILF